MCEKMASIVTDSSLFKTNDVRLKNKSFWSKVCVKCDLSIIEDVRHVVLQCLHFENIRREMFNEIDHLNCDMINNALGNAQENLYILLGKQPENVSTEQLMRLCLISGKYNTRIYDEVIIR